MLGSRKILFQIACLNMIGLMAMSSYDAIVIGAGHNGLTSAAYLGKAGRNVLVLEATSGIGGLCQTLELVEEAPGHKMTGCALDTLLTNMPRSVIDELELHKFGLDMVWPDPWGSYINPEGASIGLWRDPKRTVAEIAKFSRRDAERYEKVTTTLWEAFWVATPYFQDHPTRPSVRTVGEVMIRAAKGHRRLRGATRMLMMSPDQLIEEMFEREEVKAMLASLATWSQLPLQEPGSGGTLALISAYSAFGCSRPVGGAGELTKALAASAESYGGTIRTNARVAKVLVRDGVATGVQLENGEELYAPQVIGAIPPTPLIRDLVDQEFIPQQVTDELKSLRVTSWNLAPMTVNAALDSFPKLACGRDELWNGLMLMAPTIEHARRAQLDCMRGEIPTDLMLSPVLPSKIDRSLVPRGSDHETLYVYLPTVPLDINGSDWESKSAALGDAVIDQLDTYAPGLKSSVIGKYVKTPAEISKMVEGGSLYHVDMAITQLGPNRPTPSLSGYRTPVEGLWHTAAGAHPMGALNGWSGRTTAKVVEKQIRKNQRSSRLTGRR